MNLCIPETVIFINSTKNDAMNIDDSVVYCIGYMIYLLKIPKLFFCWKVSMYKVDTTIFHVLFLLKQDKGNSIWMF